MRAASLIRIGRLVRERHRNGHERSDAYRKLVGDRPDAVRLPVDRVARAQDAAEHDHPPRPSAREDRRRLPPRSPAAPATSRLLRDAAEALRRMINNILDLAKLEAGQRDVHAQPVVDRRAAPRDGGAARAAGAREGPRHPRRGRPEAARVGVASTARSSRACSSTSLSNAVKFTQKGRVLLRAQPWQGSISFEVDDTGVGIPPELVAAAFEPFRQIRPRNGEAPRGTGLGLTISKQLVEAMGGDLFLDSREGAGHARDVHAPRAPHGAARRRTCRRRPRRRRTAGAARACSSSKTTTRPATGCARCSSRRVTTSARPRRCRRRTSSCAARHRRW